MPWNTSVDDNPIPTHTHHPITPITPPNAVNVVTIAHPITAYGTDATHITPAIIAINATPYNNRNTKNTITRAISSHTLTIQLPFLGQNQDYSHEEHNHEDYKPLA